ncbi:hypothetical protein PFLUV_G00272490 [Perca fluviatilis]|uniref:Uncharacterized protein n=1 Tax=Perca fluviatilis TaxID=8168 RepID=A0A6A5E6V8_PERFL|nr:T-cell-specific surface glycoprotein CD28 [Perca fluviatilis]KAF1371764.1 hypothetical protein PFLUV_G00272490 [Perca fluviatilis]
MRACWMFMILLSCSLRTKSQSIRKDQLKIECVPANGNVSVPCPESAKGTDVTFELIKDDKVISNHRCNPDNNTCQCKPPCTRVGVELHQKKNTSVSFMLTGVNASSHGIYRCEATVTYPPPLRTEHSTLLSLVLVEGHQYQCPGGDQNNGFLWLWILGLVLCGIYSVIVTIIASIIWVKWRRSDSQSDYMNTKPKATRNRKKRGFQNPIPRHF